MHQVAQEYIGFDAVGKVKRARKHVNVFCSGFWRFDLVAWVL